jgi:hypothetical protein
VSYSEPADDDPTRPEKDHANGCGTPQKDAVPVIVSQLSTPDPRFALKNSLISLSVKNLQAK